MVFVLLCLAYIHPVFLQSRDSSCHKNDSFLNLVVSMGHPPLPALRTRQVEIKHGVYSGNLGHRWERWHEVPHPSRQREAGPGCLVMNEAPLALDLTPGGFPAEVGLGSGLKKVDSD